MQGYFKFGG
jgi:hypothetical protein